MDNIISIKINILLPDLTRYNHSLNHTTLTTTSYKQGHTDNHIILTRGW